MTPSRLRECPDCGLLQSIPDLRPGATARCSRCNKVLRHRRNDPLGTPLALAATGVVMLMVAAFEPLMDVSTTGIDRSANLFSGPTGLEENGLWELSVLVTFTTLAAPLLHLFGIGWVLAALRLPHPPRHIRRLFALLARLRKWSMIEVYLVGVFVAYTKLRSLVHIEVGVALWALVALMMVIAATDVLLDPEAVWEEMERRGVAPPPQAQIPAAPLACTDCGAIADASTDRDCVRCGSRLHRRKPDSNARTWALSLAAIVLYIPANTYPVLTYIQFGSGEPSTILGGARELLDGGQWPLALIVFVASVAVPVLKLIGLFLMLLTTQRGVARHLNDRTVLYRIVEFIGRWSMIDIFMESILVALVQFGGIVQILPGVGAVAFAAVVVLTMFAAESFDPRLMWDAAGENTAADVGTPAGAH